MSDLERTASLIIATIPCALGSDLTKIRSELGISVQAMADLMGVSRATLYRIEASDDELPPAECLLVRYIRVFFDGAASGGQ